MKRTIFLISITVLFLTACTNISSDETTSSESESTTTGKTSDSSASDSSTEASSSSSSSVNYTVTEAAQSVFEISSATSSVTISGLSAGRTLYLTKTNPTSATISSSYTKYVTGATGISLSNGDSSSSSSSGTSSSGTSSHGEFGPRHDCTSLSLNLSLPQISENESRAATTSLTTVTPATYTQSDVGTASRSIYVDQDASISTFKAETAILRAVGEKCAVWVISDNWTNGNEGGEKINSAIAEKLAANFDTMYDKIRAVFGEESNNLSTNTSFSSQVAMSDYSETGELVNIVVYDIGKDYANGENSGDIVGYFYAKDYFYLTTSNSVYKYSNKGKYFYIDGYFAANYTSTVYSTLAHEFQHMIDFGVKSMENGVDSSTAYNEMKSMLCEDVMYATLCDLDSDFCEEDSPISRLPLFNRHYADVGLEYKSSSPEVYYSYANNYAFGAWLVRNYGGIALLNEFATNAYADEKAILKALSATGASAATMEALLKNYALSCVISNASVTFNKTLSDSECTLNGYTYSLEPIDLWNLASVLPETYADCKNSTTYYKFDGPYLYGYNSQVELRPYGISAQIIGTATSSEATITFNTSGVSSNQKAYIVVE